MQDPRTLRLFDQQPHEYVEVTCACGRITHYRQGLLQRSHRLPSDTLIYDLQFRMRCSHCNCKDSFRISIVDGRAGEMASGPRSEIVVVDNLNAVTGEIMETAKIVGSMVSAPKSVED